MMTFSNVRPWPIMVVSIMAVAIGLPLLVHPPVEHRPRTALHIDCPNKKANQHRTGWGWDVFNAPAREPALYRL